MVWAFIICGLFAVAVIVFIWDFWAKAQHHGLRWSSTNSRNMYVDVFKTMITACGIAVALMASSSGGFARIMNDAIVHSAKIAVVSLILCVIMSLAAIIAVLRSFELAEFRQTVLARAARSVNVQGDEGVLTNAEIRMILLPSCLALLCFFTGFIFMANIVLHF